jgi:hypothetical protein
MEDEEIKLLCQIREHCKNNSDFLTHVINAGLSGIKDKSQEHLEKANDMETAASAIIGLLNEEDPQDEFKNKMKNLALSKLEKWEGKTSFKWDWSYSKKEKE